MGTMETIMETSSTELQISSTSAPIARLKALFVRLNWVFQIRRTRISLAELTDDQLADIGISRHEAQVEAQKIRLF